MSDEPLHGIPYKVQQPGKEGRCASRFQPKPKARFILEGFKHLNGQPIRFKSLASAERFLRAKGIVR